MSTFTNTVRKLTVDECERQKRTYDAKKADDIERLGFFSNSMSSISLWRISGSAGRAVTWLEQLDAEHPEANPHDLVEQLEMRIEDEISAHPRTFTVKHLHGVLEYARQTAAEQLVDSLMEAVGITPQLWQHDELDEFISARRRTFEGNLDELAKIAAEGPPRLEFIPTTFGRRTATATDGPLAGRTFTFEPGVRTITQPMISSLTGRIINIQYFVLPSGDLAWRNWKRATAHRYISDETPILAPKRPWWRRAGAVIATWWLDTWHAVPYFTPEAMLVMLVAGAAFVVILALLIQPGAK